MSFLPSRDRRYLEERGIRYREAANANQKGIILEKFALPPGKYQVSQADILIILPAAYPDVAPDMFYAAPHLTLVPSGNQPTKTRSRLKFAEREWQRWSRHNKQWRPGADGLWTMIKRVEAALEAAE